MTTQVKLASLLLAALAVAGCSSGDSPAPPATSSSGGAISAEQFHQLVREDVAGFAAERSDEGLDEVGRAVCTVLGGPAPDPWLTAVDAMTSKGVDAREAGSFIAYSAAAFCPDEMARLPSS